MASKSELDHRGGGNEPTTTRSVNSIVSDDDDGSVSHRIVHQIPSARTQKKKKKNSPLHRFDKGFRLWNYPTKMFKCTK
jgi:hypothetical protein